MLTTDIHIPVTQTICDTTYSDTWILVCNFYLNYNILKYSYDIFIFHSFFFFTILSTFIFYPVLNYHIVTYVLLQLLNSEFIIYLIYITHVISIIL